MSSYYLSGDSQTEKFGARLADSLGKDGAILFLHGELGAGKTTLSRGVIRALGHSGAVKSPTYTLVEPYEDFDLPLYHFDLYRLSDPEEVEFLGVEDCFRPPAVNLIEWPDRGRGFLPRADVELTLTVEGDGRRVSWRPMTKLGEQICCRLAAQLRL